MIFTRATGTPTLRAAFGSPPTAKTQLPKRVLSSTQVATRGERRATRAPRPARRHGRQRRPGGVPITPISPSQRNSPLKAVPAKSSTTKLSSAPSVM